MMVKMKKLIFKQEYGQDILEGKKSATIRLTSKLKKGDIVEVRAGFVKIGTAVIEDVETKKIKELSEEEVRRDGFKSKEELMKALRKIYGKDINERTEVKLIKFRLLGRYDEFT
ncbi:MAG TPA: ASCH domain-containing protein [Acidilobales archaeon]|nr:ASCH domain-containing protein [Acidilobales archaeon]